MPQSYEKKGKRTIFADTFQHKKMHHPQYLISDEQSLDNAGVHVTAVRLLVWRHVRHHFHDAFNLQDLMDALPTVDRSTLFRTLTTLTEAHLLHEINDGSGTQKYCVCHYDDTRQCEGHVHLTCKICHRTYCLNNVRIPHVALPSWFELEEAEYVVKGVCERCKTGKEG